jgi:hypothetical protein
MRNPEIENFALSFLTVGGIGSLVSFVLLGLVFRSSLSLDYQIVTSLIGGFWAYILWGMTKWAD